MKKLLSILKNKATFFFLLGIILSSIVQGQTWNFMSFPDYSEDNELYGATMCPTTEEIFTLEKNAAGYFSLIEYEDGNYLHMNSYFPAGTDFYESSNILATDHANIYIGGNTSYSNSAIYLDPHTGVGGMPVSYIPITPANPTTFTKITSVVRDDQYIYITGNISSFLVGDLVTFGGTFTGSTVVTINSGYSGFVAKFSFLTNSFEWVNIVSESNYSSYPTDLCIDNNGDVFVTGILSGTSTPSITTIFHTGGSTDYTVNTTYQHESFIFKMSNTGVMDLTWGFKRYADYQAVANDIKADPTDDAVYFISKRDEIKKHSTLGTGSLIWTKTIPNATIDQIALNSCGNMYATGSLYQSSQNRYFSKNFNKVTMVDDWISNTTSTTTSPALGSSGKALLIRQDDQVEVVGDFKDPANSQYMTIDSETPSTILSGIFYGRLESGCCESLPLSLHDLTICEGDISPTTLSIASQIGGIPVGQLSIVWKLNGVIIPGETSTSLTFTPTISGTYSVEVIFPGCNVPVVASMTVIVYSCAPCVIHSSFSSISDDGCTYIFTNTTPTPAGINITNWQWTVNGVQVSTFSDMSYTFSGSGTYDVCLTVFGENGYVGCYDEICQEIVVEGDCGPAKCKINSSFSSISDDGCTYIFTNTTPTPAGINITNWQWTVNGAQVSTLSDMSYTFPGSGIYEVCLTVFGENGYVGCYDEICQEIEIEGECEPAKCKINSSFSFFGSDGGCTFNFTNTTPTPAGINITGWQWTINGNPVSTLSNMSYTFPGIGVYEVCLTVFGENGYVGCYSTICQEIEIENDCLMKKYEVLKASPNPSNGSYLLNISLEEFNADDIKVYNILGDEVSFISNNQENSPSIELQTDKSGMYILILQKEDVIMKTTLIKY